MCIHGEDAPITLTHSLNLFLPCPSLHDCQQRHDSCQRAASGGFISSEKGIEVLRNPEFAQ